MKKTTKILSLALAALLAVTSLAGCGEQKVDDGKVTLKIGNWPTKAASEEMLAKWDYMTKTFNEMYPDVELITGDTYTYDVKTFNARAAAKQLPNFLETYFTEIDMLMSNGYTSDITDALKNNDLLDKINPDILEIIRDENGVISGIPTYAYAQGLAINRKLFEEAGLVNEDGTPKVPETYQELAEFSQIIREKTGVAGFVHPTINNCGGWIFMNIAWSYGVKFEEQNEDGTWKATFDSPEFREALQYMYDLRWKYNALPDNKVLDNAEYLKLFGVGQAAMCVANPETLATFTQSYGMNKDDVYFATLPAGPAGRFVQTGGGLRMFFEGNTPEQNDYGVKWLMLNGYTPDITEEAATVMTTQWADTLAKGGVVFGEEIFPVWSNPERAARYAEISKDYANVDPKTYAHYKEFKDVTLKPEEAACCQQLYAVLDGVIQEVWTNENANIDELTKKAVDDFQKNHLDKMDY